MRALAFAGILALSTACPSTDKRASQSAELHPSAPAAPPMNEPTQASQAGQGARPALGPSADPAPAAAAFPLRWSEQLGVASLADLPRQLAATGGIYGELSLGDKTEMPKSCEDWQRLHAAGYEPSTTIEVQPDLAAKSRCVAIALLQRAKPASRSFVRELKLVPKTVAILPAQVASSVAPDDRARVEAAATAGHSLKQLDPKLKAKKGALPDSLEITEGDGQSYLLLEPLAWGDFNGDGLDDMLVSVSNGASAGSSLSARVMTLSRESDDAVLRVLEVQ